MIHRCLVGGWATPLKNMSSSIGMISNPICGKIKDSNQTTNQMFIDCFLCWCLSHRLWLVPWQSVWLQDVNVLQAADKRTQGLYMIFMVVVFFSSSLESLSSLQFIKFHQILVGGWATPLKNMTSSIGMISNPIYGKIKNGNQTTNQKLIQRMFVWAVWINHLDNFLLWTTFIVISSASKASAILDNCPQWNSHVHSLPCPSLSKLMLCPVVTRPNSRYWDSNDGKGGPEEESLVLCSLCTGG